MIPSKYLFGCKVEIQYFFWSKLKHKEYDCFLYFELNNNIFNIILYESY